jgi:hypothetical protein
MQSLINFTKTAALRTQVVRAAMIAQPSANFAKLNDKERGDEKNFFNKEDEKLLKGLLKKMSAQTKAVQQEPAECQKSLDALKDIFKKHKLDETAH